jgi:hypothetical protein
MRFHAGDIRCPEDFVDGETVVVCLPGESLRGVKGAPLKELRKSARAAAKTAAAVTSRLFASTPAPPRYRTVVLRAEGAPQVCVTSSLAPPNPNPPASFRAAWLLVVSVHARNVCRGAGP